MTAALATVAGLLQLADMISTIIALRRGAHEANKVVRAVMDRLGVVPALVLVKGVGVALALYLWRADAVVLLGLMCALYIVVVVNNARVLRRLNPALKRVFNKPSNDASTEITRAHPPRPGTPRPKP